MLLSGRAQMSWLPLHLCQDGSLIMPEYPHLLSLANILLVRGRTRSTLRREQSRTCPFGRSCNRGNVTVNVARRRTTSNLYRGIQSLNVHHQVHVQAFFRMTNCFPSAGKCLQGKARGRTTFLCSACQLENRREGEQRLMLSTEEGETGWRTSSTS